MVSGGQGYTLDLPSPVFENLQVWGLHFRGRSTELTMYRGCLGAERVSADMTTTKLPTS